MADQNVNRTSTKSPEFAAHALRVAHRACDAAALVLNRHYGRLKSVQEKFQAGLVSEADRESEDCIKSILLAEFPDHRILGEETGLSGENASALWMIDPLDGTTNYVHRVPFWCSSIGLEVDGELLVGVIDAPALGWRYEAVRGGGAKLNGQSIRVSTRGEFRQGLYATGFSSSDHELHPLDEQLELLAHVVRHARGIRRLGAAALDLCLVAEGVFDGFWESNLQPWDTAAGVLIAREAGAVATDFTGREFEPRMKSILCAPPAPHAEVLQYISRLRRASLRDDG